MALIHFTTGTICSRWFSSNKSPELESLDEMGFSTISQTSKHKIKDQDARGQLYDGDMLAWDKHSRSIKKGSAVFCMYSERLNSNRIQYWNEQQSYNKMENTWNTRSDLYDSMYYSKTLSDIHTHPWIPACILNNDNKKIQSSIKCQ